MWDALRLSQWFPAGIDRTKVKSFTVILALLIAAPALADTTVGKQTYMVTARESQVLSILKQQAPGTFGAAGAGVLTMNSVVSFTASADDQIVVYDHWEDGFETDAYAAPPLLKATTLRFRLFKGQTISLTSTTNNQVVPCTPAGGMTQTAVPVGAAASCNFTDDPLHTGTDAQTVPLVATTQACSYACSNILTSPRGVAVRFDGGDRISTIGGGISLIHEVYPQIANSERWATSLEHFSKESLRGFLSFRLPIGQTGADPFRFARAFVTAFEDNTTITLDNGTKNVTVTLNSGQSFSTAGTAAIVGTRDETNLTLAESLLLVAGTRLDADKEVAVAMTNVSTAANPAIDLEAVLPVRAYGRDFVLPHGAPLAGMTHRLYLFNPNETAATVTVFNRNAVPTTINIPANSQGTHDLLAQNWAVSAPNYPIATRLRSDVPIWGIGIHDLSFNSDYSYALVPTRILTNEYVIPYTPTAAGAANNGNAIFIAPTEDLTKVEIYYPGSATPSIVDIDGSGTIVAASDCPASYACNSLAPSYTLRTRSGGNDPYLDTQRNSALKFFGGGTFANLAGTRIVASAPIVVTYQQDADVPGGTGTTFDMGFSIIPPSPLLLESLLDASVAATPATLPLGATPNITLNMSAASGSEGPVSALVFRATLDADFLSVGGPWPATVTKPGGGTYVVNAVEETSGPVPPAGMRRFRVTLDTTGPNATQLQPFQTVNVALTLTPAAAPTIDDSETISIDVDAIFGGQPLSPTAQTTLLRSPFTVTKTAPASVITGQQFTYVFQVTNTGGSDINNVVLHDVLPEGLTFVAGSGTGAACTLNAGPGEVDCTLAPATVTAGQVRNVTFDVIAGALPGGAVITNRARVESGSNANLAWSNEATTTITAPVWTVTTTPALSATMNQNTQITFTACAQTTVATTNVILSAPIPTTVPGLSYVNNSFRSSTNGVFTGFGNPATPATQAFASVGANIPICIEFKMLMANTAPDNSLYSMVGTVVSTQSPERQTSPALTIVCTVANNGPTNTVPGLQTTNEDVPLVFSSANVNRIQTSDPDSGPNPLLVTLSVTRGTLTLGAITGLTFSVGDGTTDTTMTFTGTVANVNNAIATITFIPTLNLASPPNAVLTLNVNDQGNTGTGGAASDNDTVNITVNAVDDPPLFTSSNAVSVPENQTAVTTATATDAEGNAITFSLNGGADAALFSITSGGVLTFLTAKDFENPTDSGADNVYDVIVRATSNGLSTDLPMAVTVTNVNEPPVFTSSATVNVAENQTAVTTATASDPENDARTFTLNGGADASFFSITSGGVLTFQSARDFEAPADAGANNVYNVIVR
ncbi:MAG: DUF11 domain-containing protein, partial [Deltaproteobacteria bacterium]|nr:DUF11 domain-containing protein [Deltaproteobacteria bacterium]